MFLRSRPKKEKTPVLAPPSRAGSLDVSAAAGSFVPAQYTIDDIPPLPIFQKSKRPKRRVVSLPVFLRKVDLDKLLNKPLPESPEDKMRRTLEKENQAKNNQSVEPSSKNIQVDRDIKCTATEETGDYHTGTNGASIQLNSPESMVRKKTTRVVSAPMLVLSPQPVSGKDVSGVSTNHFISLTEPLSNQLSPSPICVTPRPKTPEEKNIDESTKSVPLSPESSQDWHTARSHILTNSTVQLGSISSESIIAEDNTLPEKQASLPDKMLSESLLDEILLDESLLDEDTVVSSKFDVTQNISLNATLVVTLDNTLVNDNADVNSGTSKESVSTEVVRTSTPKLGLEGIPTLDPRKAQPTMDINRAGPTSNLARKVLGYSSAAPFSGYSTLIPHFRAVLLDAPGPHHNDALHRDSLPQSHSERILAKSPCETFSQPIKTNSRTHLKSPSVHFSQPDPANWTRQFSLDILDDVLNTYLQLGSKTMVDSESVSDASSSNSALSDVSSGAFDIVHTTSGSGAYSAGSMYDDSLFEDHKPPHPHPKDRRLVSESKNHSIDYCLDASEDYNLSPYSVLKNMRECPLLKKHYSTAYIAYHNKSLPLTPSKGSSICEKESAKKESYKSENGQKEHFKERPASPVREMAIKFSKLRPLPGTSPVKSIATEKKNSWSPSKRVMSLPVFHVKSFTK